MIDEITLVRELRPDVTPPDQLTATRARRAVLRVALARRRRRVARYAAGAVAAAAAAITIGIGVPGGGGQSAMAAELTAAHLAVHPSVGKDEYLHIERVERTWGYGAPAKVDSTLALEYWIPGDGSSTWIERSGAPGAREDNSFDDWGPRLYVEHASDPAGLLRQLRDYARANEQGADLHGVWTVAFWIVNDPVAPESFKTDVMNAVMTLDGVRTADPSFTSPGLSGLAITMDEPYGVWFVVDPASGAFRGIVGHPEKDKTWVGPEEPQWTVTFETDVVADAP